MKNIHVPSLKIAIPFTLSIGRNLFVLHLCAPYCKYPTNSRTIKAKELVNDYAALPAKDRRNYGNLQIPKMPGCL